MPTFLRVRVCVCVGVCFARVCVCVCPPLDKGFSTATFSTPYHQLFQPSRGMERTREAPSNEAPHVLLGYHQGRLMTYLQSTVAHAVHSFGLIHGFSCVPSPKQVSHCSRLCIAANRASETFSTIQVFGPFRLAVPSPSFPTW